MNCNWIAGLDRQKPVDVQNSADLDIIAQFTDLSCKQTTKPDVDDCDLLRLWWDPKPLGEGPKR